MNLKEGNNTFTVRVVDLTGATTTQTVNIYRLSQGEMPEIQSVSVTPNKDVSIKKPAAISAAANQSLTWSVKVVNPSGVETQLKEATGTNFRTVFVPDKKAKNGVYSVVFSGVNEQGIEVASKEATFRIGR
ncbi:hypothetical protein ACOI1C_10455 [Bacillus sp. DJP31]|uniref:hypothetical protein n=1 Tax=Bacillus sp. DJP31 TaxID=3409789 RepID=UPI003BB619DE